MNPIGTLAGACNPPALRFGTAGVLPLLAILMSGTPLCELGLRLHASHKQRAAIEKLRTSGSAVFYDYHLGAESRKCVPPGRPFEAAGWQWKAPAHPPVPRELVVVFGKDFFAKPVWVFAGDFHFDDDDLAQVGSLTTLRRVAIPGTSITDEGLRHLKRLKNLRWLALDNCDITDGGLGQLSDHKRLEYLALRGTKVSRRAVESLRRQLPHTRIDYGPEPTYGSPCQVFALQARMVMHEGWLLPNWKDE